MTTPTTPDTDLLSFEGVIDTVTHANADTGFAILKLRVDMKAFGHLPGVSRNGRVTLVGPIARIEIGEKVKVTGKLTQHKTYGPQIEVTQIQISQPKTQAEIAAYLSKQVSLIGPRFAAEIVRKFGEDTISIIDNTPDRLLEIPGIGEERLVKIKETWAVQKSYRELLLFTTNIGLSAKDFDRIYKKYKEKTVEKIKEDPYRLARDIWGIGFAKADEVARHLGIQELSELRVRAAVEHQLYEATNDGHCYLPANYAIHKVVEFLEHPDITADVVGQCIHRAISIGFFKCSQGDKLFLPELYQCEELVADRLAEVARRPLYPVLADPKNRDLILQAAAKSASVTLDTTQCEAILRTLTSKVSVITGGPGTGKTTITKAVVAGFERAGLAVTLLAPTGRAAKRMAEVIGRPAGTIHRLLFTKDKAARVDRTPPEQLRIHGVVIVDEFSMVDVKLFAWLLKWLDPDAVLVMVGDKDQLPSVSAGAVLRDLLASTSIPSTQLTKIHRQAAGSAIIVNAHKVNEGIMPTWDFFGRNNGWPTQSDLWVTMIDDAPQQAQAALWCATNIVPGFGLDPRKDCQILAPGKNGDAGVIALNTQMQQLVNPTPKIAIERGGGVRWGVGDKMMQMKNDYTLDVFNGDQGVIVNIDKTRDGKINEIVVAYDDREVVYEDSEQWNALQLCYASTIHKVQGSEFPVVIICLHTSHWMMLQRNLLYTGLTRGRKLVILIANGRALSQAIQNNVVSARNTMLTERLFPPPRRVKETPWPPPASTS